MRPVSIIIYIIFFIVIFSCTKKNDNGMTPWGSSITEDGKPVSDSPDTLSHRLGNNLSLDDIIDNGELIIMTISSPETYYDYRGRGMGTQYFVCERFAKRIGVALRVELCADSAEAVRRVREGEGDIAVFRDFHSWTVGEGNDGTLARELKAWYTPTVVEQARNEQKTLLSHGFVKRRVFPYMLNRRDGIISSYDQWFRLYAPEAGLEWTFLAAQCYQESCFDPQAHSWAGACGLMQIMPSTADGLGLPRDKIYNPEDNIHAAVRLMAKLQSQFSEVRDRTERLRFALAGYNAGPQHVRDAMALARKYGKNPYSWHDVREYILALQQPEYYTDPVVKRGYMRGSETAAYVDKIIDRWQMYRGSSIASGSSNYATPQRASGNNKYSSQ